MLLAGAFGNYLNPASACRMGLLPEELLERITSVGNAAGSSAKLLACDRAVLTLSQTLTDKIKWQVCRNFSGSLPNQWASGSKWNIQRGQSMGIALVLLSSMNYSMSGGHTMGKGCEVWIWT